MRALQRAIAEVACTDLPVLLVGESGTGKAVVALEIHRLSHRRNQAFLSCNCAVLNVDSLPTHLQGGQGGEDGQAAGDIGDSGTVLLDEISQLEPASQSRLLYLLPEGEALPLGRYLSARLISTTTRNIEEEMRACRFREALYYRINGVCLRLPSLRQRKEDIPALLAFFLNKYAALFDRQRPEVGPATMDLLLQHSWPGNVRELENVARKIVAFGDEHLALSDLAEHNAAMVTEPALKLATGVAGGHGRSLKVAAREASRKAERGLILEALERTHWNRKRTARELQISYKALLYKLKQLGLDSANDSVGP
jgi:two-component system, NtrC family, response regulator AtoC